jgi:hypothetical protein
MQPVVGDTFPVGKLTGFVESVCPSGAVIAFARVSSSGFTRTGVGDLTVMFPCNGRRRVRMQLALPLEFHRIEFLEELRTAVFATLKIANEESWLMIVSPRSVIEYISDPPEGACEFISYNG